MLEGNFSKYYTSGKGAHEFYWMRDKESGSSLLDHYLSVIEDVSKGIYTESELVTPKKTPTVQERKENIKEQKMFNALYKAILEKETDDAKPLHYEAGISVGTFLISFYKAESVQEDLNLMVIDSGILCF